MYAGRAAPVIFAAQPVRLAENGTPAVTVCARLTGECEPHYSASTDEHPRLWVGSL